MPNPVRSLELVEEIPRSFHKGELSVETAQAIHRSGKVEVEARPFDPEYPFILTSKGMGRPL